MWCEEKDAKVFEIVTFREQYLLLHAKYEIFGGNFSVSDPKSFLSVSLIHSLVYQTILH